jgi:PEP-CTERM/exosortase A-associated glycosyltransferase
MRILHILDHSIPLHSGYAFRTRSILEQQRMLGWKTIQLTSSKHYGAAVAEETIDGFHFYRTAPSSGLLGRLPILNQYSVVLELERRLHYIVNKEKPDILHAHSPCLTGIAALNIGRRYGLPIVYEMRASWEDAAVDHGTTHEGSLRYRFTRFLETNVLKRVDAITTICEGLKQDILSRGIDEKKISVIPNAVNIEQFPEADEPNPDLKRKLGLENKRIIGFIGSFYDYEGLDILLRALPLIKAKMADIKILLVGGGPQEENLKNLTQELNITEYVEFAGRIPHDQVTKYYDLIEVLVYPRRSMRLTELVTPLKPLEAMAQKRLLVASDVGGHKELIRNGETGTLFKAGNSQALAEAVTQLMADNGSWKERLEAAKRYVERERTWKRSASGYIPIYERLANKRN